MSIPFFGDNIQNIRKKGVRSGMPTTLYLPADLVARARAKKINLSEECRKHLTTVLGNNRAAIEAEAIDCAKRSEELAAILKAMRTEEEEIEDGWRNFKEYITPQPGARPRPILEMSALFNQRLKDIASWNVPFKMEWARDVAAFTERVQKLLREAGY